MDFFTYRIVDERGSGGGSDAAPQQQGGIDKNNPVAPKDGGGGVSDAINLSTIQQMGRSALNLAVGHVGYFSGSTAVQNRVNAGAQLAGTAIQIATNPIAGIANLAFQLATRAIELAKEKSNEAVTLAESRRRAGASYNQNRR